MNVEHFQGRCHCGSVYDRPIPEFQAQCAAWEQRHRDAGHMPTTRTYSQKTGADPEPSRE